MPVTVYKSTDASAPVLTGIAGSLITVLDAVLVNGYGAKAAAGWTKPFTGTNLAQYRNHATGTNHFWRVDDASPSTTAVGREAQIRGSETASAISTVTGPFPTTGQIGASGLAVRKSATADAIARPWMVVADNKTAYLFTLPGDFTGWSAACFGDLFSLKTTTDAYRSTVIGRETANSVLDSIDRLQEVNGSGGTGIGTVSAVIAGHYMPRPWQGDLQSAIQVGKHTDHFKGYPPSGGTLFRLGNGVVVYPNPIDASLMLAQVWVHEDAGNLITVRGRLRGLWSFLHPATSAVNDQDTFSGTGSLAGKTFVVVKPCADGNGMYVLETSDTWEAN